MCRFFVHPSRWIAIALALCVPHASAEGYPDHPLRIIAGYTAGGTTDVGARLVAQYLSPLLGQTIVVENKPGAGGTVGSDFVAKAAPDGYTLLMASASNPTQAAIKHQLPFEPVRGFAWVSVVTTFPFVIVTGSQSPLKSLGDVIAVGKAQPRKIPYGSAGVGTAGHFLGEWLSSATGSDMLHVPFRGQSNAMIEVMAGRIDLDIEPVFQMLPHIKSGKMRALAVTSLQPTSYLPDVPPVIQKVPGFEFESWLGIAAPAGTPPEIITRLNRELRRMLGESEVQKRLAEFGGVAAPSSPEEMRARMTAEVDRWRRLVKERHIEQQ